MPTPFAYGKQGVVLAGLTLALVMTGISPLGEGAEVEARKRDRSAAARGDVTAAAIQEFSNPATVSLGSGGTTTIDVSGFDQPLTDVNVTLSNITQPNTVDLDILLVGPGGQTAIIFSDVGFNSSANNLTVTLDDQAPSQVPGSGPLVDGAFQPTNFQSGDTFASPPAPVATPPSGSQLGVFNGTDPNGAWSLFIRGQSTETGSLGGGWSLRITAANGVPNAAPDSFQAQAGKSLTVPGPGVLGNDRDSDSDALTAILAGQPRQAA